MDLLPPLIQRLAGPDLASELARARLSSARGARPQLALVDAIALGRAVGLGVSEMQRSCGCSRQTIYNLSRAPRERMDDPGLALEVASCALAVGGETTPGVVADRLQVEADIVLPVVARLVARGEMLANGALNAKALISVTPRGEARLRDVLDQMLSSRPEGIAVYLAVAEQDAQALDRAAGDLIANMEHTLIDASVAPSTMREPELAMVVHAASIRTALEIAQDLWDDLRERADLEPAVMRVASVLPSSSLDPLPSAVLDAFVRGIDGAAPTRAVAAARRARARFDGRARERDLAGRCLTAAASALRLALGRDTGAPAITNGDQAFEELSIVAALHLDAGRELIQKPLISALDRACETLGPFPGGRVASFRAPDGRPAVIEPVQPTETDLIAIAEASGTALGAAAGAVDVETATLAIVLAAS